MSTTDPWKNPERLFIFGSETWTDEMSVYCAIGKIEPRVVLVLNVDQGASVCARHMASAWAENERRLVRIVTLETNPLANGEMPSQGPDCALALGPLYDDRPLRLTTTGDLVRRLLDMRVPVRWIATPNGYTVQLAEMPATPTRRQSITVHVDGRRARIETSWVAEGTAAWPGLDRNPDGCLRGDVNLDDLPVVLSRIGDVIIAEIETTAKKNDQWGTGHGA